MEGKKYIKKFCIVVDGYSNIYLFYLFFYYSNYLRRYGEKFIFFFLLVQLRKDGSLVGTPREFNSSDVYYSVSRSQEKSLVKVFQNFE